MIGAELYTTHRQRRTDLPLLAERALAWSSLPEELETRGYQRRADRPVEFFESPSALVMLVPVVREMASVTGRPWESLEGFAGEGSPGVHDHLM